MARAHCLPFSVIPLDFLQGLGTSNNPFPGPSSGELMLFCSFAIDFNCCLLLALEVDGLIKSSSEVKVF